MNVGRLVEVTHLDPEGEDAIRERRHDSAVAEAAAAFQGVGIPVAAGWRWVVSWDDGQLVPDLWVQLPVPGREARSCWVAVEVEFSAKTKRRIEEKLRSYRLAPVRLNTTFPVLVITGEPLPAKRFDELAEGSANAHHHLEGIPNRRMGGARKCVATQGPTGGVERYSHGTPGSPLAAYGTLVGLQPTVARGLETIDDAGIHLVGPSD